MAGGGKKRKEAPQQEKRSDLQEGSKRRVMTAEGDTGKKEEEGSAKEEPKSTKTVVTGKLDGGKEHDKSKLVGSGEDVEKPKTVEEVEVDGRKVTAVTSVKEGEKQKEASPKQQDDKDKKSEVVLSANQEVC